jgi:iron complex outermembrane recepter protein
MALGYVAVQPAHAQEGEPVVTAQATAPALEQIQVTGSRITRSGYTTPTPLTVLGEAEINAAAPSNIAEFVQQIPSVVGSASPATSNLSISAGTAGVNSINLRALGSSRTLVLLDGQRSVPSLINGTVDVNTFPQSLVQRVEVVTGGASAAYGSDAVSGVVNFILDKEFEGLRINVDAGETTYGDDRGWKASVAGGVSFAGGRGHLLLSGEVSERDGIYGVPRDWNNDGWYIINNPDYTPDGGLPERLVVRNAGLSNASPGGIITNTPLRGTAFGIGGVAYPFAYGDVLRDPWMVGGDWRDVQVNDMQSLNPEERRSGVFGRVSYEITPRLSVFAQASWNKHAALQWTGVQFNQGNVIIRTDNAFLPQELRDEFAALGIDQFNLGTTNADLPVRKIDNERTVTRFVVGAEGDFDLFGRVWNWDAYYQRGETETFEMARDITNNARLAQAQDAVFHPDTGQIVCRSSVADPGNGCVPFNRMGIGVNSQEALDYILGNPFREQTFTQDVAALNVEGEPFSNWAGPVSVAAGLEHRREEVSGVVAEENQSGWFVGNYLPSFGSYDVTEGYVETVVPLMAGLDFNGAVRGTEYSTSGFVTTWKAGLTYAPVDDLLLRVTRSRDIRAPNLQELFQAGSTRTNNLIDPFNNNASVQFRETVTGNVNLRPETADAWGLGFVYQPSFAPGLGLSVDYYQIELDEAIGSVTAQTIVDRCFAGNQDFCGAIVRGTSPDGASVIEQVSVSPFNFAQRTARGVDFEASYRVELADVSNRLSGSLSLRAIATHYLENYLDNGIDTPTDTVGQNDGNGPPDWVYRLTATYALDPITLSVTGRGVSEGVYDNSFIQCTSGCPASTADNRTIDNNSISGAFYIDTTLTYALPNIGNRAELFFNVKNMTNEDPEIVAYGPAGSAYGNPSTNVGLYDYLGRVFRVGARFEF